MRNFLLAMTGAASLLGGCEVGVRTPAVYVAPAPVVYNPGPAYVAPPMVEVEPGVQVISDYDQPVFYSDNMYWRYDGGIWYSSRYHTGGWVRSERVPDRVRGIDRPEGYAHYRQGGGRITPIGGEHREVDIRGGQPVGEHREVDIRGGQPVGEHREVDIRGGQPAPEHREVDIRGGAQVAPEHREVDIRGGAAPAPQHREVDIRRTPPPPPKKKH